MNKASAPRFWILCMLAVLILTACRAQSADERAGGEVLVTVERGDLVTNITAVGSVRPSSEVSLAFEASGRVTKVLVRPGDPVDPGQILAQLDTSELELQVRGAEASLAGAEAQLALLRAGPKPEEVRVVQGQLASAEAALVQAAAQYAQLITGTKDSEIVVAQAAWQAAQSRVVQLQRQLEQARAQDPSPEVDVATVDLERVKIARDDAQDQYNKALDRPWEDQEIRDSWAKELQQAQLSYQQAQARLNTALNSQRAHEISLLILAAQITEAQTSVDASLAQLLQAQDGLEPRQQAAAAAVEAARAQRDIAQAQLDLLLADPSPSEIASAQAAVDHALVALESARLSLERAILRAPFDATVDRVYVELGEFVNPQLPGITLVSDGQFSIEANVDEADVGWLRVGQAATISLDAFPGQSLSGSVVAILPSGTLDMGVVSYQVTISLDPTELALRPGMTANTEFVREQREAVLLVPNRAIWIDPHTGKPFVEKVLGEERVDTYIEQGLYNDEYSEVVGGLQEGDQVVVRSESMQDRFREVVTMPWTRQ